MAEYIDRKKIIDIINTTCPDFNIPEVNNSWAHKLIVIIREALVELVKGEPAADVRENVEGKWIGCADNKSVWFPMFRCSKCLGMNAGASNFCPYCGAKMEKDERLDG